MAGNRTICTVNNVDYLSIRKAMVSGARTEQEIIDITGICNTCDGCKTELDGILKSVCGCFNVMLKDVIDAVKAGADTVDKVAEVTKAGSSCQRCKGLIANIIELGR